MVRTTDDNEENWLHCEASPVNKRLHLNACVIDGCKYCVPRDPDNYLQDFDRICSNEEVCTNCDKFAYSIEDLHKESVKREMIRKETIEEIIPVVMNFFNELAYEEEGVYLFSKIPESENEVKNALFKAIEDMYKQRNSPTTIKKKITLNVEQIERCKKIFEDNTKCESVLKDIFKRLT